MNKIYKVERVGRICHDEFRGFICIAPNEKVARAMHPAGSFAWQHNDSWININDINKLIVTCIGKANKDLYIGIQMTDFLNA